jgi:hypothetical protein
VGLHVTGAAGITIQPPRPTHARFGFQDTEIPQSGLFKPDGQPDARKSGADDQQLQF